MKVTLFQLFFFIFGISIAFSQENPSPYHTDLIKDGAWITGGVGLNVLGVYLIQEKKNLSPLELKNLSKHDIWGFDRWAVGNSSDKANKDSYIPLYGSFALPFTLLLDKNVRNSAGQISVLFVETMATTGALFTLSAGLVQKSRPLVYNTALPEDERAAADEQRSFFAGHTAATAAATFFAAKVFHDFNPNSPLQPYIWGVAAAIPAVTGYLRIKSGKHFLSDNLIGYAIGAASGILIPELHKKKREVAIYPVTFSYKGDASHNAQGIGMTYTF